MSRDTHDPGWLGSFPGVDYATWRRRVEEGLGGRDFESSLVAELVGGLRVEPLYTATNSSVEDRGEEESSTRRWQALQTYRLHDQPSLAQSIAEDLSGGVEGFLLRTDRSLESQTRYPTAADLDRLFPVEQRPQTLLLDISDGEPEAVEAAYRWLGKRSFQGDFRFGLGIDPLLHVAHYGDSAIASANLGDQMRQTLDRTTSTDASVRTVSVSTAQYFNAGADHSYQVALALSTAIEYLRTLEASGVEPIEAVDQIEFRFGIGKDLFGEIAKLRAFRRLWCQVAELCSARSTKPARVHAETAERILTGRDVPTNLLRTTVGTVAAVIGGADTISCVPYDSIRTTRSARGRRLARNIQHLLREESHLGIVGNAATGSYYIESLTAAIESKAWQELRTIECAGGAMRAFESGAIQRHLEGLWEEQRTRFRNRSDPITGISFFADPAESAHPLREVQNGLLPAHRDSEEFEGLRARVDDIVEQTGERPTVALIPLPSLPVARGVISFARNYLRSAGLEVSVEDTAAISDLEGLLGSGASAICLCVADSIPTLDSITPLHPNARSNKDLPILWAVEDPSHTSIKAQSVDSMSISPETDAIALLTELLERIEARS